jgi:hypothetical protein
MAPPMPLHPRRVVGTRAGAAANSRARGAVLSFVPMGSKGSKPRKPKHSQHLPKVGTSTENERLLHEERSAVLDQMGVGGASPAVKVGMTVIAVILVVGAILGLLFITIWR